VARRVSSEYDPSIWDFLTPTNGDDDNGQDDEELEEEEKEEEKQQEEEDDEDDDDDGVGDDDSVPGTSAWGVNTRYIKHSTEDEIEQVQQEHEEDDEDDDNDDGDDEKEEREHEQEQDEQTEDEEEDENEKEEYDDDENDDDVGDDDSVPGISARSPREVDTRPIKHAQAVLEIVDTEKSYCNDLTIIKRVCIQRAAIKKTLVQKLQFLHNGISVLYEITANYYGENLLQIKHASGNINTKVCVNGATFGFQWVIFK